MTEKQRLAAKAKLRRRLRGKINEIAKAIAKHTGRSYTRQAVQNWYMIPEKYAPIVEKVLSK